MKKFSKFLAVIVFAFVAVGSSLLTISCANNAGGGGSGSESSTSGGEGSAQTSANSVFKVTAENVAEVIRAMTQSGSVEVTGPITDSTLIEINSALVDLYGNRPYVKVDIDLRGTSGVDTFANDEFYGCENLVSIGIPASVTNLFGTKRTINSVFDSASHSFDGNPYLPPLSRCSNFSNIYVADENSVYKSIDGVLYSKDGKTLIRYPAGKESETFSILETVTTIFDSAFSGSTNLKEISLPTNLNEICRSAFISCSGLTSIVIPNGVSIIKKQAFAGCCSLTNFSYNGTVEEWRHITVMIDNQASSTPFSNCPVQYIHCIDGDYKYLGSLLLN